MSRPRPSRRPLLRLLIPLAILLGFATNIAVAWRCAAVHDMFGAADRRISLSPPPGVSHGPSRVLIEQTTHVGSLGWSVSYHTGVQYVVEPEKQFGPPLTIPDRARPLVMPWESEPSRWPTSNPPKEPYAILAIEVRSHGWPLQSLYSRRFASEGPTFTWTSKGALHPPLLKSPDGVTPRWPLVLPYYMLPTGMIVNTAVYTAVWIIALIVPGWIRRTRRRRNGMCGHCAYDLRATPAGKPCPECGEMLPTRYIVE